MKDMRDGSSMDVTCTFKRGGKCEIHGAMGTRNTSSKQIWEVCEDNDLLMQCEEKSRGKTCVLGQSLKRTET